MTRPGWRGAALFAVPAALFALLLWAVRARHGASLGPDRPLHHWVVGHRPAGLTDAARLLTATGTGPVPYVAALVAGWTACPRTAVTRRKGVAALVALAVLPAGQAVRTAVMAAVARPRPPAVDWATGVTGDSFPSGHTTTTALAAGLLAWSVLRGNAPRPIALTCLAVCACWAVGVGATRVYLGVHWPTDVLGGWLLAAAWLALALPVLTRLLAPLGLRGS